MTVHLPPAARLRPLLPYLLDLLVPLAGYFLLHAAGLGDVWALTLAGSGTALVALVHSVRARRLDALGLLVAAELAVAVVVAAATDDPRLVLVRPAFYLAVGGTVNLVAAFVSRPLTYAAATPMATKGDPDRLAAYQRVWDHSEEFRAIHRRLAVIIGGGMLLFAAVRVLAVYTLSIGDALVAQEVPGILLIVVVLAVIRLNVPALTRLVDQEQAKGSTTAAVATTS